MAINYIRLTVLKDVRGRINYITDKDRQEKILQTGEGHPSFNWDAYCAWEREYAQVGTNQGRELVFALPNEWINLEPDDLNIKCKQIITESIGKYDGYNFAVHHNHKNGVDNLHMHVVFCEREINKDWKPEEREVYKKDTWIDEFGQLAKSKKDRHTLLHKKGDLKFDKNGFPIYKKNNDLSNLYTKKDPKYGSKTWLNGVKSKYEEILAEYGIDAKNYNYIHQVKEHKGLPQEQLEDVMKSNHIIKQLNLLNKQNPKSTERTLESFKEIYPKIRHNSQVLENLRKATVAGVAVDKVIGSLAIERGAKKEASQKAEKEFKATKKQLESKPLNAFISVFGLKLAEKDENYIKKQKLYKKSFTEYQAISKKIDYYKGIRADLLSGSRSGLKSGLESVEKDNRLDRVQNKIKLKFDLFPGEKTPLEKSNSFVAEMKSLNLIAKAAKSAAKELDKTLNNRELER